MNYQPIVRQNCVFCCHFGGISGRDSVRCKRFGGHWGPARESACAFWSREPGSDDEPDVEFWRELMERQHPERPRRGMRPPAPEKPTLSVADIDRILREVESQRAAGLLEGVL